jgi:transcriptional regulator with XRE-family HTH domain
MLDFATKLRTMRQIRNMSQVELAELSGVPNSRISDMESHKVVPVGEWETRLKAALNWPTDESAFEALLSAVSGQDTPIS